MGRAGGDLELLGLQGDLGGGDEVALRNRPS